MSFGVHSCSCQSSLEHQRFNIELLLPCSLTVCNGRGQGHARTIILCGHQSTPFCSQVFQCLLHTC
jgi:hypothetical protein